MSERATRVVYLGTLAVVLFLVLTPLAALFYGSVRDAAPGTPGHWTLRNWADLGSRGVVGSLLSTFVIGVSTALLATLGGAVMAWITFRTDFRWARLLATLVAITFYFPGFILAMAWVILASPGGILNALLRAAPGLTGWEMDVYTHAGIIWIMTLHVLPFVFLTLRGPLSAMDGALEEAARVAGANRWRTIARVTVPLLTFPLLAGFLLTFVLALEQFAIPAIVGIPGQINVLATQLYLLTRFYPPNYGLATAVGLALSALTAVTIWAQRRIVRRTDATTITGRGYRPAPLPLGAWCGVAALVCFGYVFLALVLPMVALLYTSVLKFFTASPSLARFTIDNYRFSLQSPATWRALWNTLIVAGGGALLGIALGCLSAYFVHRMRPRGHRVLDLAGALPFGVPGIVIGLGLLWSYAYLPLPIYGTIWILVLSYITRYLPYATETVGAQLVQIDRSLEEAARLAGASRLRAARRVLLPLLAPALQSGWLLLFMAFFREISSAVLLYTPQSTVVSVQIWSFYENANWGHASALSVMVMLVVLAAMGVVMRWAPRPIARGG